MANPVKSYNLTGAECKEGLSVVQSEGLGGAIVVLSGDLSPHSQLRKALERNRHEETSTLDDGCCPHTINVHKGELECGIKDDPDKLQADDVCVANVSNEALESVLLVSAATQCDDAMCEVDETDDGHDAQDGIFFIHAVPSSPSPSGEQCQSDCSTSDRDSMKHSSRLFECDFAGGCGRTFSTSAHLKYHNRTHTGEKPFPCAVEGCGRNFTSSGHLKYHQSTHSGEKPFKCQHDGCDRVFAWPAHLKYHIKTHLGDRPYNCTFEGCAKSFYVLQRLNVHMRVHTGERPFTCEVEGCMKSFTTAGNLKNHMRIHTGERPYTCPFENCGRTFTEHSSLRKHKLTHTGEKPYLCDVCGKMFSQSGSRNAHHRRHTLWLQRNNQHKDSLIEDDDSCPTEPSQVDSGEDQDQTQELIYSPDMVSQTTTAEHLVLAHPIVAKEVSIETTPVQTLHAVVQSAAEELIASQQAIPESSTCVVSLAEAVVAQQALIQSMLNGAAVIPTSQTGSTDELSVVEHVLQHHDVEQMMQSVVNQQILSGQIQLPISEHMESHDHHTTLTVEVPSFMSQTGHAQNLLVSQQEQDVDSPGGGDTRSTSIEGGTCVKCEEFLEDDDIISARECSNVKNN